MTKTPRPRQSRPDRTDNALLLLVDGLLDDFFADSGEQDRYETLARGGPKAGEKVSLQSVVLPDRGAAELSMRVGSPEITVAVIHPQFSATVTAHYDPNTAMMIEGRVVRFAGDRKIATKRADKWFEEMCIAALDDDDEDLDDAFTDFLSGDESPFEGESDPGEPPLPSPADKAMVNMLGATLRREMKRKKPDVLSLEDDMALLEGAPQSLWPILDGLIAARTASPRDETLINAFQLMLETQLTLIRYRIDRGWDWAVRMAAEYQEKLLEIGREGRVPPEDFSAMVGALGEARIDVTPETRVALADAGLASPDPAPPEELRGLLSALMDQMATATSSPFDICGGLGEATRVMPSAMLCFMAHEFALSSHAVMRDTVPMMLLAEEQDVRRAAAAALDQIAAPDTLSSEALRRMIAIRNWVPEADRPPLDQAIRNARLKGVECAQWPPAQDLMITTSIIDGSGAQNVMLTSRSGRQGVLSGMLFKLTGGVADSWCDTDAPRRDINETLATLRHTSSAVEVDRAYLDDAVQHAIAAGALAGRPPGTATLQIAELVGGSGWRDRRLDIVAETKQLFSALPPGQQSPAAIEASLKRSGAWIRMKFAESWFLDDADVREIIKRGTRRDTAQTVARLLTEAMPKRRGEWAERFLLLALRARAAKDQTHKAYANDFIILAHSLCGDRDLATVPLMVAILQHTVDVARTARW